jgi:hypothetical protein
LGHRKDYALLDERAAGLAVEKLDKELAKLRGEAPAFAVASLGAEAYNSNLLAHGHKDQVMELTIGQRVASWFA